MIIKDNRGREYTLTSIRLAEVRDHGYGVVFSVTKKSIELALRNKEGVQYEFKIADNDTKKPLAGTKWLLWGEGYTRFEFSPTMARVGCATFTKKTAALISKTMGLNVRKTTRG